MIRRPPRSTPKPSSAASDVYKRQGIEAQLFTETHHDLLEQQWLKEVTFTPFGQALSLMIGSFRSTRLKFKTAHLPDALPSIICNLILPTQLAFLYWVIRRCQEEKITRLYFVSRDGEIMKQIADLLNDYLGTGIEMRYLYGSRKSWLEEDPKICLLYTSPSPRDS